MKKITTLDYAILGLLNQIDYTGYGIRMQFETTALGTYSSSPGAIYPALKRLTKLKLIVRKKGEKEKMVFHITRAGEKVLRSWCLQPISKNEIERRREDLLLKFAFMETLVSKGEALLFLTDFVDNLSSYISELSKFQESKASPLPQFGRLAFQHGIESCRTTLKWCKKTHKVLSE